MSQEQRDELLAMAGDERWQAAVDQLYNATQTRSSVPVDSLPAAVDPSTFPPDVSYDAGAGELSITGPLTPAQRDAMTSGFPLARPLDDDARDALLSRLRAAGPLAERQVEVFHVVLDGSWTVPQLRTMLDAAGVPTVVPRSACAMYEDQQAGIDPIPVEEVVGGKVMLNEPQAALLETFARDESMTIDGLVARLRDAGDFTGDQERVLRNVLEASPTVGERNKTLAISMMQVKDENGQPLPLNAEQREMLVADYAAQKRWRQKVGELYIAAHDVKYPWSGEYRSQGDPFWWLYEYVFKPLQATIFAMLAFYVASAAFRAFRAKNIEAILLLGTAFIILLGRTFAGVFLTGWFPDAISGLKIENLTMYIMQVFNTAGNRAIMIGIALGITSTSLKVLLGVDRSYLGSGEE